MLTFLFSCNDKETEIHLVAEHNMGNGYDLFSNIKSFKTSLEESYVDFIAFETVEDAIEYFSKEDSLVINHNDIFMNNSIKHNLIKIG